MNSDGFQCSRAIRRPPSPFFRKAIDIKPLQPAAKFGVGRSGGMEKTSLISLTSEERGTRPHIGRKIGSPDVKPKQGNLGVAFFGANV